jgi:benzoate membrane transport protein
MIRELTAKAAFTGFLTTFVGFAASFAVVMQGLYAVGATDAQVISGIMMMCLFKAICEIYLSLKHKMPVTIAWSTPGAALLASTGVITGGFPAAVGAFIIAAVLIILAGLWKPLERLVSNIPLSLANAMLAGVLLPLCLAPFTAITDFPLYGLMILIAWLVVGQVSKLWAVPAALTVFAIILFGGIGVSDVQWQDVRDAAFVWPEFVYPQWNLQATIGIALPLFVVTMASQNITGYGVLRTYGYAPKAGELFWVTGLGSAFAAPFGGHGINLAAITAAMCASEEAGPDPSKRYWASIISAVFYLMLVPVVGAAIAFVALAPVALIKAVAGLALIGAFVGALEGAVSEGGEREAAGLTFLITASGISLLGISAPFWGLMAGIVMLTGLKWRAKRDS